MNKYFGLFLLLISALFVFPSAASALDFKTFDTEFEKINWVGDEGINTYIKTPESVGYIDFITVIDLTQNDIKMMTAPSSTRQLTEPSKFETPDDLSQNWTFTRGELESFKKANPEAKFVWDAAFFNLASSTSMLALSLKSEDEDGVYITSGARAEFDMDFRRRMLIIDNENDSAKILDFDREIFIRDGDQAIEGFHPFGKPEVRQTSRVFVGVRNQGKELLVYCSKSASQEEAVAALELAGVSEANQMELDGGGSAACGYNLPGHYFVEPVRPVPIVMGAFPSLEEGSVTIEGLNVRTGIGTSNPAVRKLSLGTKVKIYEEKDGWMRISENEWVYGKFIQKVRKFPYEGKVKVNNLNVRSGIGVSYGVTRRLALGETVKVLEEKNGWLKISENEWVSGKFIE